MDYNITGRADYKNKAQIATTFLHRSNKDNFGCLIPIQENQIIAVSSVIVKCIAGYSNFKPYPPNPMPLITIPGLIEDAKCDVSTRFTLNPYQAATFANRQVKVHSSCFFELTIILEGTLYTCNKGKGMLSLKEAIGFAMSGMNYQGQITLDEAAFDDLNKCIIEAGGPDFRSLPFSLESLNRLPLPIQNIVAWRLFSPDGANVLGLPMPNEKSLPSAEQKALLNDQGFSNFLSDAVASQVDFDSTQLKKLAKYMIECGWCKTKD